jgi:hypothetical protein
MTTFFLVAVAIVLGLVALKLTKVAVIFALVAVIVFFIVKKRLFKRK